MNEHTVVARFIIGDVEDPRLIAESAVREWQQSTLGQWVQKQALASPTLSVSTDPRAYGYVCTVTAKLSAVDATYFKLAYA